MRWTAAAVLAAWTLAACNREGNVHFTFIFREPLDMPLWFILKIEERPMAPNISQNRLLSAGGPVLFDSKNASIEIKVSNGKDRVAIVEGRAFPGLDSPVRWYGISERFEAAPGIDIEVPIFVQPLATPRPPPDDRGVRIETNGGSGFVNDPRVTLILITDRGVAARISNDRTFPEDERTIRVPLAETATDVDAPAGFEPYRAWWDLEHGQKEPCPIPGVCGREVFVQIDDENNYHGITMSDRAWLDREPPRLREETLIEPRAASPTTLVKVTVVASEVLRSAPPIVADNAEGLIFERLLPEEDGPSNTYTYLSNAPSAAHLPDGEYVLRASLTDLAGNTSDVVIGTLVLDGVAPSLSALDISPKQIGPSGDVRIRALLGEDLPEDKIEVTFGSNRVERCSQSGDAPTILIECVYTMRGDEIAPDRQEPMSIRVFASDHALNRSVLSDTLFVDFRPPRLNDLGFYPSHASAGARATLRVSADEALGEIPALLTWSNGQDPGFTWTSSISAAEHLFHLEVPETLEDGVYALESIAFVDAVRNRRVLEAANEPRLPISVVIDKLEPRIENVFVDVGAPALGLPETSPPRINGAFGRSVLIQFSVTDLYLDPNATRVFIGGIDITQNCVSSRSGDTVFWSCAYAMTGAERPGLQIINIRTADLAANFAVDANASVLFDFEPPSVAGAPQINLVPGPGNPLRTVARVKEGTTVELRFERSEETIEAPSVTAGTAANPAMFTFTNQPRPGSILLYTYTLGPTTQQGTRTFTISMRDLAGNDATISLAGVSFRVDTIAPAPASVSTADLIVLDRKPHGDAFDPTPRMTLSGGPGAAEGSSTIIVSSPFSTNAEITRIAAAANGSFPEILLNTDDIPTVRLEVVDTAGNVSPAITARDGRWTGSLNGKIPGSSFPNPHQLKVTPQIQETIEQAPAGGVEREAADLELLAAVAPGGGVVSPRAVPPWQLYSPSSIDPGPRMDHGLAYDARRARIVLFGGIDENGTLQDDTWEHDGEHWIPMSPLGARPSTRSNPLLVYDAAREHLLLVGGQAGGTLLNDVWSYDGVGWTELMSNAPFSPRTGAVLGYHEELGVAVMFGGRVGGIVVNETWVWDGQTWSLAPSTGAPPARDDASMGYLATGRLVLFGGRNQTAGLLDDTWSWSNGWTAHLPGSPRPTPRARAGMATDPDPADFNPSTFSPRVVLVSGDTGLLGTSSEVWDWNGSQWTQRTPVIGTSELAGGRMTPLVYDAREDRFFFFGGRANISNVPRRDTWAWNRSRWVDLSPSTNVPPASRDFAFAASDREAVLFSGFGGDTQVWRFGQNGQSWESLSPSGNSPGAREGHAMATFQPTLGAPRFVLFGGKVPGPSTMRFGDTWIWSGGPSWSSVTPAQSPSERYEYAMTTIPSRNEVILFGGFGGPPINSPTFLADTWIFNGAPNPPTWTPQNAACPNVPEARRGAAIAFYDHPVNQNDRVFLFGGSDATTWYDDLWSWTPGGSCWTPILRQNSTTPWPSPRRNAVMVFDPDRGRVLLYGGEQNSPASPELGDFWALTHDTSAPWIPITPGPSAPPEPSLVPPRYSGGAVFDSTRQRVIMFGGEDHTLPSNQTYILSSGVHHRPGARFTVEWGAAGVAVDNVERIHVTAVAGGRGYHRSAGIHRSGAVLRIWDPVAGHWFVPVSNTGSLLSVEPLTYTTPNAAWARRLISAASDRIEAQVTTLYVDYGREIAELAVDHIELRVDYRL